MDAQLAVPEPRNETVRDYAPASAQVTSLQKRLADLAGSRLDLTNTIDGVQRPAGGDEFSVVQPHRHAHVLGVGRHSTHADAEAAIAAAKAAAPIWRSMSYGDRAAVFLRAADLLAGPWRDTLNAATMLGQSKTVYQAEIDAACELIDFLRFNVAFGAAAAGRAADLVAGRVEPVRPPAARRLRLRDHAVQLHRDRRQPARVARADGQHRGLEAVADAAVGGALHHAAVRGGRPAARRHQHADRRRHRGERRRPGRPGSRRHPFHRLDQDVPAPVADRRGEPDPLPQLPATRRGDRRQGLRHRPPVGRHRRAAHRADPRRVRLPGPEVLGGVAGVHPAIDLGQRPPRPAGRHGRRPVLRRRRPTSRTTAAR